MTARSGRRTAAEWVPARYIESEDGRSRTPSPRFRRRWSELRQLRWLASLIMSENPGIRIYVEKGRAFRGGRFQPGLLALSISTEGHASGSTPKTPDDLWIELQGIARGLQIGREQLGDLRKLEAAQRVDHSQHVDEDGAACGETRTWKTKLARDVAMILDRMGVPEETGPMSVTVDPAEIEARVGAHRHPSLHLARITIEPTGAWEITIMHPEREIRLARDLTECDFSRAMDALAEDGELPAEWAEYAGKPGVPLGIDLDGILWPAWVATVRSGGIPVDIHTIHLIDQEEDRA